MQKTNSPVTSFVEASTEVVSEKTTIEASASVPNGSGMYYMNLGSASLVATGTAAKRPRDMRKILRGLNYGAAALHLLLGITAAVLFIVYIGRSNTGGNIPALGFFFRHRISDDGLAAAAARVPGGPGFDQEAFSTSAASGRVNTVSVAWLVCGFFFITALAHLMYATVLNDSYTYYVLIEGRNPYRWFEYAITASMMALVLCAVAGVHDVYAMTCVVVSIFVLQFFGFWFETSACAPKDKSAVPLVGGFLLLAGVIGVVVASFVDRYDDAKRVFELSGDSEKKVPAFVWAVFITTLVNFSIFGMIPLIQKWRGGSFVNYEFAYLFMSAQAKTLLGALIAWGVIARVNAETA